MDSMLVQSSNPKSAPRLSFWSFKSKSRAQTLSPATADSGTMASSHTASGHPLRPERLQRLSRDVAPATPHNTARRELSARVSRIQHFEDETVPTMSTDSDLPLLPEQILVAGHRYLCESATEAMRRSSSAPSDPHCNDASPFAEARSAQTKRGSLQWSMSTRSTRFRRRWESVYTRQGSTGSVSTQATWSTVESYPRSSRSSVSTAASSISDDSSPVGYGSGDAVKDSNGTKRATLLPYSESGSDAPVLERCQFHTTCDQPPTKWSANCRHVEAALNLYLWNTGFSTAYTGLHLVPEADRVGVCPVVLAVMFEDMDQLASAMRLEQVLRRICTERWGQVGVPPIRFWIGRRTK